MQEKFITSASKTELFVRDWTARRDAPKQGSVLVVHGLGEHSGRYAQLADMLSESGFDVRAFDQQGHGRTRGKRGVVESGRAMLRDLRFVFEDFAVNSNALPFLLGHSMGGAISLRAVADSVVVPRGLILSSPAIAANLSFADRLKLAIGGLIPDIAVANGLNPDHVSRDTSVVAEYLADPLVHDRISPRLARFILECGRVGVEKAALIEVPTLLLVAGEDRLVNPQGSRELFAELPENLATMIWYDGLFHEVFNELPVDRERVFADLRQWLVHHACANGTKQPI